MALSKKSKEEVSVAVTEASNILTLDQLPPEMLQHIFKFLSFDDLLNVASVSDTWKDIVKVLWEKFSELKLHPKFLGFKPTFIEHRYPRFSSYEFEKVLEKRGKFLKKLDLSEGNVSKQTYLADILSDDSEDELPDLSKYCPNLESIKCCISGLRAMQKNLKTLTTPYIVFQN